MKPEFRPHALYGAFVIGLTDNFQYDPFGYSLSRGTAAMRSDTNLIRCGANGLPSGWEMIVQQWRARTSEVLSQPVLDFASTVAVELRYNGSLAAEATLLDLLTRPVRSPEEMQDAPIMLRMREHRSFEARVNIESESARGAFKTYLQGRGAKFWIYLEGQIYTEVY